jgi:hypothetical protein
MRGSGKRRTAQAVEEKMEKFQKKPETRWSPNLPPGFIVPEALYTIEEVKARLRMGDHVWRQFRRKGLKPTLIGRRAYILGATIIEVFNKITQQQEQAWQSR